MATLPYQPFPENEGVQGGLPEQGTNVIPGAFGAGVVQATEKASQTAEQIGQQQFSTALKLQEMQNETAANENATGYADYAANLVSQYRQKEGTAADQAWPQFQKDLQDGLQKYGQGLSPAARLAYERDSRSYYQRTITANGEYRDTQIKAANDQSWQGSLETSISEGALHPDNPDAWNQSYTDVIDKSLVLAHGRGQDEAGAIFTQQKAVGELTRRSVDNLISSGKIDQAKDLFDRMQKETLPDSGKLAMDPASIDTIGKALRTSYTAAAVGSISDSATALPPAPPAPQSPNAPVNPATIQNAIFGQESNYGRNVGSGAISVGPMQIRPDTFKRYAQPGEDINNPNDNKAVGSRIIDDLSRKYNGDTARVAVAYFSGEGNVAPAGSPTPYVRDLKDANGKSVSSYVADIQHRVASTNISQQTPTLGIADYYRQNYAQILEHAGEQADQQRPGDEQFRQRVMARTEQKMNDYIRQQELSFKADGDIVMKAFNGDFTKGSRPTSVEQLTATSPEVKAAWDRLSVNNPLAATAIENRVLTANGRGARGDVETYGEGYLPLFHRMTAPPGDPQRITDQTQLYSYVDAPGGITVAGLTKLTTELKGQEDSAGQVLAKHKSDYFKGVEALIDKSNPLMGKIDQSGKYQMYLYQQHVDQMIGQYQKAGKDPGLLFTPGTPDYLGMPDKLAPFQKPMSQSIQDMTRSLRAKPPAITPPPSPPRSPATAAGNPPAQSRGPLRAAPVQRQPNETPQQYLDRIGSH